MLGQDAERYEKRVDLEKRVNGLREKYGESSVRKGITLCDNQFGCEHKPHKNGIVKIHNEPKNGNEDK